MGNGFLLIIAGLLLFYVVISDKFYCIAGCAACLTGKYQSSESSGTAGPDLTDNGSPFMRNPSGISGVIGIDIIK